MHTAARLVLVVATDKDNLRPDIAVADLLLEQMKHILLASLGTRVGNSGSAAGEPSQEAHDAHHSFHIVPIAQLEDLMKDVHHEQ